MKLQYILLPLAAAAVLTSCQTSPSVRANVDAFEAQQSANPPIRGIQNQGEGQYIRGAAAIDGHGYYGGGYRGYRGYRGGY